MREIVEQAKDELLAFVNQREAYAMVVEAGIDAVAITTGLLEEIETEAANVHWMFPFEFHSAEQYVGECVGLMTAQLKAGAAELEEEELAQLAPIPASIHERSACSA